MREALAHLIQWYQNTLDAGSYPLIILLMAAESTIVPIPSETIIPFAAQNFHTTGIITLLGLLQAGKLVSLLVATIIYSTARLAVRQVYLRYCSYFIEPEAKDHAAERWDSKFGSLGVFVESLLPVVRHLIGIHMGIVKMNFLRYSIFTLIGSCIW